MRFEKFTQKAQDALSSGQELVDEYNHQELDIEHVFIALLNSSRKMD